MGYDSYNMKYKHGLQLGLLSLFLAVAGTSRAQKAGDTLHGPNYAVTNSLLNQVFHKGSPANRMAAKTSIAAAPVTAFPNVAALLEKLPAEPYMQDLHISDEPNSDRVEEEKRNVTVDAWVYATYEDTDNSFQLWLGTDPKAGKIRYLTAKVSALPLSGGHSAQLLKVRQQTLDLLGPFLCVGGFRELPEPIHAQVSGSMFYSRDFIRPPVGPKSIRPQTAWEIHPVTEIVGKP
jgi:hypothetical protein